MANTEPRTMEEYIPLHAKRYHDLVARFDIATGKQTPVNKPNEQSANANVAVIAKLRPLLEAELDAGFPQGVFCRPNAAGVLDAHELKRPIRGPPILPTLQSTQFQVDQAFSPDASTDALYDAFVKPLVSWAWGGGVGTLFAYGQTGSGKTYTVSHLERMAVQTLMSGELEGSKNCYISIFELAGNAANDLLNSSKAFSVLEDSFGVVQLAGALEHHVTNASDVLAYIETAASFRKTGKTIKNDASSRSHAIFRVRIQDPSDPAAEDGMLYLVDLAGSEAARDVATYGPERTRETREINTSLSVLKDCIRAKAEADAVVASGTKTKPHVPFRQSTLTKVLKHVFNPHGTASCKTVVVACVNPCLLDISASRNTMRYAEMLRVFAPKAKAAAYDPEAPMTWSNAQLRAWIENNSGTPAIDPAVLAPFESGIQLLRLAPADFEARCLKTAGVPVENARAFRAKFWQKHVDAQKMKDGLNQPSDELASADEMYSRFQESSSKDPDLSSAAVPFRERIRPGMVVKWTGPEALNGKMPEGIRLAVIMCPVSALDAIPASVMHEPDAASPASMGQYLCAMVVPGLMTDTFTVELWRQVVLDVEWMEDEMLLVYDGATRYYHLAV